MVTEKLRVGVLFGGRSGEHEVSLMSAAGIMRALNDERYDIVPVGIAKDGRWWAGPDALTALRQGANMDGYDVRPAALLPMPAASPSARPGAGVLTYLDGATPAEDAIDIFFPVLHGPLGEDGTVQGLFELAAVAYVGAGVVASAVGMDKDFMKVAFRHAGLPIVPHIVVTQADVDAHAADVARRVDADLGYPCFVKPANLGSSVGISRVVDASELADALAEALRYDAKIVVEAAADNCREIEVSVLGNEHPQASVPGEIVPAGEFYDYEAKYEDEHSRLIIPARIDAATAQTVRDMALRAFRAVDGAGLARVDFFVHKETEAVWVNEINTMPGFTPISMYPKLWEATNVPYSQLLDKLIQLGLDNYARRFRPDATSRR